MEAVFSSMGDSAVSVRLSEVISAAACARVAALDRAVADAAAHGQLPGLTGTTRAFTVLTLHYDPLVGSRAQLEEGVRGVLDGLVPGALAEGRSWRLPVSYEGEDAPDLAAVAEACGLGVDEVVRRHAGTEFQVYVLGFLPGFPFMGDLPESLRVPRRANPRTRVPAGAVAITGQLGAIYPWQSPGGWNLIGRCPARLFNPEQDPPALLAPGDRVRFDPTPAVRVAEFAEAIAAGELDSRGFLEQGT